MKAILFVYVWPEPYSSAAGVRTVALLKDLRSLGFEVVAASPCRENTASAALNSLGISTLPCSANDSSAEAALGSLAPDLVLYDRFVMEEQFGWRARALWPNALHIVDSQDLHSVRRARERKIAAGVSGSSLDLTLADWGTDRDRELASFYRADAVLVVSPWEKAWVEAQGYPADRVHWLPFPADREKSWLSFAERFGFCFLGNFRHPPNLDGTLWLAREIWPKIRAHLPFSTLTLYGAYPPAQISSLHGCEGIAVVGPVGDHRNSLKKHRVLLAPLRFGAGIKGKVLEAWASGTVVVGTPVAMEGLGVTGFAADFVEMAKLRHEEEEAWREAQDAGFAALAPFTSEGIKKKLEEILALGFSRRAEWREHLVTRMLKHHQQNSTKYFSRWIEAKNKNASPL